MPTAPVTNLPADLPEDWTLNQVVSPLGTDQGYTPQHGYNYLMASVNNAAKAVNAILDSYSSLASMTSGAVPVSQGGTGRTSWPASGIVSTDASGALTTLTSPLPIANGGTGRTDGKVTALATARTITTNLASTTAASFDGSANVAPGVTGTLAIANGGTGSSTVAGARNALGLGNTDGPVPVANGGTGQTTVADARNALGLGKTAGALPIANGGTGVTAFTPNSILYTDANGGLAFDAAPLDIARGGTGAVTGEAAYAALGVVPLTQIPNIPADRLTSGVFAHARIPFITETPTLQHLFGGSASDVPAFPNTSLGLSGGTATDTGTDALWVMAQKNSADTALTKVFAIGRDGAITTGSFSANQITGTLPIANGGTGRTDGKVTALATARTITTNLASTTAASFDGSANVTPGVSGILPVANGGTGLSSANSVLTNLASTTAASIFAASPRPGVTGVLPIANGGTGADTVAGDGTKGKFFASGASSTAAAPSFRTIVAADIPTLNQNTTGSAATLTTARTIQTNLASTSSASFNGSANVAPGVTGILPIANGGTGADTRVNAMLGLSYIGKNPITSPAADTSTAWIALGNGYAWFDTTGQLTDQPSQYGFVINYVYGGSNDIFQIWKTQSNGPMYLRSGNSNGWGSTWRVVYDCQDITGKSLALTNYTYSNGYVAGAVYCKSDGGTSSITDVPENVAFFMEYRSPRSYTSGDNITVQTLWSTSKTVWQRWLTNGVASAWVAKEVNGVATQANKLSTARTIQTNLASTSSASFDGSANITPGVTGTLLAANGGTGRTDGKVTALATARTIQTNLGSTSSASFDGSANVTPGVTGTLPIANGGTGAATVAGDGTKGKVFISVASTTAAAPSFRVLDAADVPTLNQNTTGSAAKLATARTIQTNLGSTSSASFDGSANITPGVTGTLPIANGGTGMTANPSMLTNLATTTAASVLAASPRPGVTGTLPIGNGGTGATTRVDAMKGLSFIGVNPVTSPTGDTVAAWAALGTGYAYFDTTGQLTDQPSQYGFVINYIHGSLISQIWQSLASGVTRKRTGQSSGWGTSWIPIADKLATARAIKTNLASTAAGSFDGSADVTVGVTGTLPVANGGTGLSAANSLLTNLASTTAATTFTSSPRPGVTGTLPVGNGGTGATTLTGMVKGNGTSALSAATNGTDYLAGPTSIPEKADLNSYVTPGMWRCTANATVATLTNCPTTYAFSLFIELHAGVKQTLTEYMASASSKTWWRNKYDTSWGPWTLIVDENHGKAVSAGTTDTATKLASARTIQTNLGSTSSASFDGSANITPGVTGTLLAANGGTGRTDGKVTALATARTIQTNLASTSSASFDGSANVTPGVTGTLPIANGGTGAATVAGDGTKGKVFISTASTTAAAPSFRVLDAADVPTLNQNTTGSAAKLATARTIQTNLASTSSASFDGSANITPGVTGTLPIANGGTGAATVAGDGTKGKVFISVASTTAAAPSFRVLAAADIPTLNQNTTGSAAKLTTARAIQTNLASTSAVSFDGSADVKPGVTGTLPIANGGTGATTTPSLLTNLASTTGASPYAASPRPGVTGTLPKANGGTGTTDGVTAVMNGNWYEEKLGDKLYRWTQLLMNQSVKAANQFVSGTNYYSNYDLPAKPSGATITSVHVNATFTTDTGRLVVSAAPAATLTVWQYRIISIGYEMSSAATANVEIVAYGTK